MLYVQFWAHDDGRKNCLKHVQRLTEINKLWNVASCWLYSVNILAMHGPMNVKFTNQLLATFDFWKEVVSCRIWSARAVNYTSHVPQFRPIHSAALPRRKSMIIIWKTWFNDKWRKQSNYEIFTICSLTLLQSILLHDSLAKMYELEVFVSASLQMKSQMNFVKTCIHICKYK